MISRLRAIHRTGAQPRLRMASSIGGAFVLGAVLVAAVSYANAPSYQPVTLAGDAMLCRASGVRVDLAGVKYYPALPMQPEPVRRGG